MCFKLKQKKAKKKSNQIQEASEEMNNLNI